MMLDLNVCLHSPHIRKHDQADSIRDDRHTLRNISTPFYWANVYCSLRLILALGAQKPRCDREEDDDDEANNETPPGHILAHAQYHEQYRCIGTRSPCLQMYCQSEASCGWSSDDAWFGGLSHRVAWERARSDLRLAVLGIVAASPQPWGRIRHQKLLDSDSLNTLSHITQHSLYLNNFLYLLANITNDSRTSAHTYNSTLHIYTSPLSTSQHGIQPIPRQTQRARRRSGSESKEHDRRRR